MPKLSIVLLLWLTSLCIFTQINSEPIFSEILNSMLNKQGLASTRHIERCFSNSEQLQLQQIIVKSIQMGKDAASSTLPEISVKIQNLFKAKLSPSTISCIRNSHDVDTLLRHRYFTSFDLLHKNFSQFSKLNFHKVHYYFSNMSELAAVRKWSEIGGLMDNLCKQIYSGQEDPWIIRAEQVEKMSKYFGISVSNGIIGAVSSTDPFHVSSTVLAGVYDKIGRGRVDNLVQTFSALSAEINFNGGLNRYNVNQQLNMKEGSFTTSFSSDQVSLTCTSYALRNLPFVFYTSFSLTAHMDGQLEAKNFQTSPSYLLDIKKNFEQIQTSKKTFSIMSTQGKTKTGKVTLTVASAFLTEENDINFLHQDWDSEMHFSLFRRNMKKGQSYSFALVTSLMSTTHHEDPLNQAIRMVIRGSSMSNVVSKHKEKWSGLWENDIIIEGNDTDQKMVRSMLYHCYSFINEDRSYGVSPMGLSGLGYNGHMFWDMDLWIYPSLLILNPELAESLIQYRLQRLGAARENAFINGYKGAMYPWESSQSGAEQTPVWALTGPMQHHISGCVSFAVWNYYSATQDLDWLKNKGFEVIWSVAQFFASRVELDSDGYYHIKNVVGSDEWAEYIDDDAFTNGVAKISLQIANKAAKLLNYPTNPQWDKIRQKIVILKMQNGVTREHSTYNGQPIKQADANLLSFPLKLVSDPNDVQRDLEFYETRVPNQGTPAMTSSVFALLYSRLKNQEKSYHYFLDSFTEYVLPPFNVFAEGKGGTNPYFLTGAGGVLQSMVFGYGGFDITETGVVKISTVLPKQWKSVTIKKKNNSKNQKLLEVLSRKM